MDPTRVVLDCDTANEVDDQFAIANALGVPEGTLDVRGVISLHNTMAHGPGRDPAALGHRVRWAA
ncbi:MAG: hypothetical protein M3Q62_14115 [Actinomycetota bacterium]|jgi:inosine-uridine nucleoside N-ribohydrolase|nr:hypothetical protein [Rubrobacteraceae bacterium]MDQ3184634.1 hypothetical protein [Actinomycetota bacterium]MDQ3497100.1 hypothetical protein [Actinomycetota bacterium]